MTSVQRHLSHQKYRPDIDGLRAIAVLAVVAYHAFPEMPLVAGGFIGVDVFFVISGFLISTVILENLDNAKFSFAEFYARRIRRIFPALLIVLVTSYVFGWFALLSDEYKQLGKHIVAGAGFVSNIVLWNEVGYFDGSAETKPLLHLWSLGIEEQFYIIWPLLLWLAWRRNENLLYVTIAIALVSFYLNVSGMNIDPSGTFYFPQTRFWELLCGSIVALVSLEKKNRLASAIYRDIPETYWNTMSNVIAYLGAFLLAYGFCRINKAQGFPGVWAIVPVLGTVLIISAGPKAWVNRRLLSNQLAVSVGLISFPLYLWHWPLLSFLRIIESDVPSRKERIVAVVISVALAFLTYALVERPIRFGKHSIVKTTVSLVLMIIVGCIGYLTYSEDGFGFRVKSFETITKAAGEWEYPGASKPYRFSALKPYRFKERRFFHQESGVSDITLFIGDSNIEQYYVRIDELIKMHREKVNSIIFATGGGCLPIPSSSHDDEHKHCFGLMETALQLAAQDPRVRNVVIGGQWNGYLSKGATLTGSQWYESDDYKSSLTRLSLYIKDFKKLYKKVFLILNIPIGEELDPKYMVRRSLRNFPNLFIIRSGGVERRVLEGKYGKIQLDLRQIAEASGAVVIQPLDYVCDSLNCSSVDVNGEPMYKDGVHLRPSYVRRNAGFIDPTVAAR